MVSGRSALGWMAALALFLGMPADARSWGNTWMGINLERTIAALPRSIGPAKLDAALRLTSAGYDSNLYFGSAGEPVDDLTLKFGPDVRLYLPLEKLLIIEVREYPHYSYYAETANERTWNNILGAGLHLVSKSIYGRFNYSSMNVKDRLNTEVYVDIRRKEDSGRGLLLWQISRRASVAVELGKNRFDYEERTYGDENIRENLNRTEYTGNVTAYIEGVKGVRYHLTGAYSRYKFIEAAASKDSSSTLISGGLEFLDVSAVQGVVNLGVKFFDVLDPGQRDYQGLVGDVRVAARVMRLTELAALYRRDVVFSAWTDNVYYVQTGWGAELSHRLTKLSRFSYAFSTGTNRYPSTPSGTEEETPGRVDTYIQHSASLLFQLQKNLDIVLRASLMSRKHQDTGGEDQRSFYGLDFVYRF